MNQGHGASRQHVPTPAPVPPMVVEIGLREIYDLLVLLNTNVSVLSNDVRDLAEQGRDHEERLRSLERNRWPLPVVSVLAALAALVMAVFKPKVGG